MNLTPIIGFIDNISIAITLHYNSKATYDQLPGAEPKSKIFPFNILYLSLI